MFEIFIKRPVLSTVISILLTILGVLGVINLPVEQFPDIAPPTVKVTASYVGASAETVLKSVITPLEEAINGVEGMTYMTSTSSNDGTASIDVFFRLGVDPDIATVNVQNRVAKAQSLLPSVVVQTGVTTLKAQNSALFFAVLYSDNPEHDVTFIENYAKINIVPVMQRIRGVGDVKVFGMRDYSMRIWLDPQKMAAYKVMPDDIQKALREQNLEVAAGRFGENSPSVFEYVIKYKGRFSKVEEYENIIVKTNGRGQYLRLKDVGRIELGAYNYSSGTSVIGQKPAAAFGLFQTPGSNAQELTDVAMSSLSEISKRFPSGMKYDLPFNSKDFLDASMSKVVSTLVEAFVLVFLVVFLFLGNIKSTLIPIIAIPVAVIGTFFFLWMFGFSLNMLTLFALVLSIGIVVDDAIVVVEAVHVELEGGNPSPKEASIKAIRNITGAVISITLVMISVFVPVMFIPGSVGMFYKQFAATLTISIVISAINALTLSPALCALFLKKHDTEGHAKGFGARFNYAFNKGFDAFSAKYISSLRFLSKKRWIVVATLFLSILLVVYFFKSTPTGFIPQEDRGNIFIDVSLPQGSSLSSTQKVIKKVDSIVSKTEGVTGGMVILGNSILRGVTGSSYAFSVLTLKTWKERKDPRLSVDSIVKNLYIRTASIKDAQILFFSPPTVRGFGNADGFTFQLINNSADDWNTLDQVSKDFTSKLMQRPEIARATPNFNANLPQYELTVNVEKVKDAGLSLTNIFGIMQGYFGGLYTTDFNRFGKQYRVMIQAAPEFRKNPESLNTAYVNTPDGQMVSISQFVNIKRISGPEAIFRYNMFNSVSFTGSSSIGYSTGDAIKAINETAAKHLPNTYSVDYTGLSREEVDSGGQSIIVFMLCLVFVYFVLSAQYESYLLPFSVLLCLPIGIMGAFLFTNFSNLSNDIYFQVSLIMLIGLLSKNAILIVEYALQRRSEGMGLLEAAIEGARERLRPILMTAFALILGLLPLALASGVGAKGNRSIGVSAIGGMLVGTVLGILVIPFLFVFFQHLQEKIRKTQR